MPWPMDLPRGRRIISDIESNGLLPGMSRDGHPPMDRIHSATAEDIDTGEHFEWNPDTIKHYPEWLMDEVGVVIGHNFLNFDARAIQFIYPKVDWSDKLILDTLIFCKMVWPADVLIGPDMKRFHQGRMPAKYLKRQSLGAWGYRLGNYKGEYDGGWMEWSPDMHAYMIQDGKVNLDLWNLIERRIGWRSGASSQGSSPVPLSSGASSGDVPTSTARPLSNWRTPWVTSSVSPSSPPITDSPSGSSSTPTPYRWPWLPFWLEHRTAEFVQMQRDRGVAFDKEAAVALVQSLKNQQEVLGRRLQDLFGSWWQPLDNPEKGRRINKDRTRKCKEHPDVTEPRYGKKGQRLKDYVGPPKEYRFEGATECRIQWTTFNPKSRDHLADRLQKVFGWEPTQRTPSGKPMVDEGAIKSIPSSIISEADRKDIMDYFVVSKTIGMLVDGKKSWMHFLNEADPKRPCINGEVDPLGTVSSRGAHFNPNLGQVMAVKVDDDHKPILGVEGGFGFESRGLFTASTEVFTELTGTDMSSLEFILLGHYLSPHDGGDFMRRASDPDGDLHTEHAERSGLNRRDAKTLGYLIIYGGGAYKAGLGMDISEDEVPQLLLDKGLPQRLRFMRKMMGDDYEEPSDLDKARIVKGARGIKSIKEAITGLEDLMAGVKEAAADRGYVLALDGRKLHIRKPHAALNTLLQGGGAIACKLWIVLFHQKMEAAGYRRLVHYNQVLWVHDEKQNEHIPGLYPVIKDLSNEAAREAGRILKLRGEFRTESKNGRNWAETH